MNIFNHLLLLLFISSVQFTSFASTSGTTPPDGPISKKTDPQTPFLTFPDITNKDTIPVTPEELSQGLLFLDQQEIMLVGYPYSYPADGEVDFATNGTMIEGADNSISNCEVKVIFKNPEFAVKLKKGQLFAVTGKITVGYELSSWGNKTTFTIYDAELVSPAAAQPETLTDVRKIDIKKQILLKDLFTVMEAYFFPLIGKEFMVQGAYQNTVSSTVSSGTYHDVVLGNELPVHILMREQPDNDKLARLRNEKKDILVKAKLSSISGSPTMINGQIMN